MMFRHDNRTCIKNHRGGSVRVVVLLLLSFCLLLCLSALAGLRAANAPAGPSAKDIAPAYYITIEGMIDGGLASSVQRRTELAVKGGAKIIFYEIDTWGGLVDAALEITDTISGVKDAKTVAFVPPHKKAISAGALIAMSCNEIVMGPNTTLGDCEPIIPTGETGITTAPEKIQTVLRAKFRQFAKDKGCPDALVEALVSKDTAVYRIKKTSGAVEYVTGATLDSMADGEKKEIAEKKCILPAGRLLTMTQDEAVEYNFAKRIVSSKKELFEFYNLKPSAVVTQETNWSEEMVRWIEAISPILIAIGLVAIYLEFKYAGTFMFAGIAVVCFALVFFSKYMVGLAESMAVLVFIVGFLLILLEIFLLPGYMIPGFVGVTLLIAGLVLASQPYVVPTTPYEVKLTTENVVWVLGSFVGSVFLFILLVQFLPHTPAHAWTVLSATEPQSAGYSVAMERDKQLLGKTGVAHSVLRPAGRAEIEGTVIDVVTEGDFIERGKTIRVKYVDGNRIVVEAV